VVIVDCQPDLLEVVGALSTTSCLTGGLHGGEQERDQNGNDGDDDEQFNKREPSSRLNSHGSVLPENE
jgi:hypothetical protein